MKVEVEYKGGHSSEVFEATEDIRVLPPEDLCFVAINTEDRVVYLNPDTIQKVEVFK